MTRALCRERTALTERVGSICVDRASQIALSYSYVRQPLRYRYPFTSLSYIESPICYAYALRAGGINAKIEIEIKIFNIERVHTNINHVRRKWNAATRQRIAVR